MDPDKRSIAYFVMIAHSFGLTAAVYNFNRRSALLNDVLVRVFKLVALCFYDDKYGFEPLVTAGQAHEIAQDVHHMLGIKFDPAKLALGGLVEVLGVNFDFVRGVVDIKQKRRQELTNEINDILDKDLLEPGHAGKLKGKLLFAS
eukprot:2447686-Amphidinium_carterae.1